MIIRVNDLNASILIGLFVCFSLNALGSFEASARSAEYTGGLVHRRADR